MAKEYWLGFDLGGTKMMATVFDKNFKAIGSKRKKTKNADGDSGPDRMVGVIADALTEAKITKDDLRGIGVGFPGPLELDSGVVLEAPNLGWRNVDLKGLIEKEFKTPAVVANDVDVGTYGEYKFGAGQKARCVVGVFPGTGIGGGCIYEGRILRGRSHSCLEIGHMQMVPNGRLCGCGRRGCLETLASRLAIASDAAAAVFRGEAPHLAQLAGTDVAQIRSGALAEAIKEGDDAIRQIVRNAAKWLGIAVANTVNLLAPDVVVLGGGLVEAMHDIIVPEVEKAVDKFAMKSLADDVEIAEAKLGDDAGVMGAAALARETFGKE